MSDPQTAQSALVAGEIDYLENPAPDFLPILASTPGITLETHPAMGTMGIIQFNHLHPPFNNVKARRATYYLINHAEYLNTIAADRKQIGRAHVGTTVTKDPRVCRIRPEKQNTQTHYI